MADSENTTALPTGETATIIPFKTKALPPSRALKLVELPFVKDRVGKEKSRGRNFWAIDPPDDYGEACYYGEDLACALIRYDQDEEHSGGISQLLRYIVRAQIERGNESEGDRGTLIGFWGIVGSLVGYIANPEAADVLEEDLKKRREWYRAKKAEFDRERRKRYRQAALAGWEKRRKMREAGGAALAPLRATGATEE